MRATRTLLQPLLPLVLLLAVVAPETSSACGTSAVCGDATSTFTGTIDQDGLRATWSTNDEDSTIDHYTLKRYNCGDPSACSVVVQEFTPDQSCGLTAAYDHTFSAPAPLAQWKLTLEVWRTGGDRACAVDSAHD